MLFEQSKMLTNFSSDINDVESTFENFFFILSAFLQKGTINEDGDFIHHSLTCILMTSFFIGWYFGSPSNQRSPNALF